MTSNLDMMLGAVALRAERKGVAVGFGFWGRGQLTIICLALPESSRRMNDAKCVFLVVFWPVPFMWHFYLA